MVARGWSRIARLWSEDGSVVVRGDLVKVWGWLGDDQGCLSGGPRWLDGSPGMAQ